MKKRSQKLSKIVSLASSEERRCGAETGRSRRKLEEQMAKLGEAEVARKMLEEVRLQKSRTADALELLTASSPPEGS